MALACGDYIDISIYFGVQENIKGVSIATLNIKFES